MQNEGSSSEMGLLYRNTLRDCIDCKCTDVPIHRILTTVALIQFGNWRERYEKFNTHDETVHGH